MLAVHQPSVISSVQTQPVDGSGPRRWIRSACRAIGCVASLLLFSGCAIYTPYQVFRFTADYNTERRPSFQTEVFEHLPPRPVRVRLNRWAYNVGPQPTTATIPIPDDARVAPPPITAGGPGPTLVPPIPPGPTNTMPEDGDLLDESQPPSFPPPPPQPRIDLRSEERGGQFGPSARANTGVRGASYSVPQPSAKEPPSPTGAWLFGP